ncbi:YusW family protein [Lysinibacillus yapensis]|nr:YusW family protein [Lysinibacillus yapensis]
MNCSKAFITIPLLLGLMTGCSNNDAGQDEAATIPATTNDAAQNNSSNGTEQNASGDQTNGAQQVDTLFNFTHFDLDVEYDKDVSYNVEYENNQNQVSAELEDDANDIDLSGNDAYHAIEPQLESLTFDENTGNEEVLNDVISAFGLKEDFKEFDLEVKFVNGVTKKYEFTNK